MTAISVLYLASFSFRVRVILLLFVADIGFKKFKSVFKKSKFKKYICSRFYCATKLEFIVHHSLSIFRKKKQSEQCTRLTALGQPKHQLLISQFLSLIKRKILTNIMCA